MSPSTHPIRRKTTVPATLTQYASRAMLPAMIVGEEDPEIVAQRLAAAKKLQDRATIAREQKRAAAAREGKSRFARSSVLKIKEVRRVRSHQSQNLRLRNEACESHEDNPSPFMMGLGFETTRLRVPRAFSGSFHTSPALLYLIRV